MQPLKMTRFDVSSIAETKNFGAVVANRSDDRAFTPSFAQSDKSKQLRQVSADPSSLVRIVCRGRLVSLPASDIEYVKSAANYIEVHASGLSYRVRSTLKQFQNRLSPANFVKIHRCTIVNLNFVKNCRPIRRGDSLLTLQNGRELVVSRKHKEAQNALRTLA